MQRIHGRNGRNGKSKSRRVDLLGNDTDFTAYVMGQMGQSNRSVQDRVELSNGQISYRLRKASTKRSDFRDGTSPIARKLISAVLQGKEVEPMVIHNMAVRELEKKDVWTENAGMRVGTKEGVRVLQKAKR